MSSTSKAKQRIQSLLDANSFVEIGARVKARATDFNAASAREPSDGVITGYGLAGGRLVYIYSQNADVLGGSIGEMHARKIVSLYEKAARTGAPVIGMIDSAGIRLREGMDALNAFGAIYARQAKVSGVIPQITAIFGNCGGGLALFPALTDFTLMEKDAKLFVNSPNALAGNREEDNDTASASKKAAAGDVDFVGTEDEIIEKIRHLIDILPSNNEDDASGECLDSLNRVCSLAGSSVDDPAAALSEIVDAGSLFETKREYAKEMLTGIARLGGNTVGIIANRAVCCTEDGKREQFAKGLTTAGCKKAASLVRFCDAFDIPVISFTNVSGFAATKEEEDTVASAAASLAAAFAGATVPKINVITGRAGAGAYSVMNSCALGADLTFAYENASVGILEGKYAAKILCSGTPQEAADTARAYDALQNSIESAAARGYVDEIVDPQEIRKQLIGAVEVLYSKREMLPQRKHASI